MADGKKSSVTAGVKEFGSVIVIYDDGPARQRAVEFCGRMVERFWAEYEFDVHWCSFSELSKTSPAEEAIVKAAAAAVIIFATSGRGEIPRRVRTWIDKWLPKRADREGLLVDLRESGQEGQVCDATCTYLRAVAHQGCMDYLTDLPHTILRSLPDSLESVSARACQVTSVLDGILRAQHRPPTAP